MIDTVLNLLFRCSHRHLTRPVTPARKAGEKQGGTYVVCLDCGKQFAYDFGRMKMGEQISQAAEDFVLAPGAPKKVPGKMKLALAAAALPVAWVIGQNVMQSRKRPAKAEPSNDKSPGKGAAPTT